MYNILKVTLLNYGVRDVAKVFKRRESSNNRRYNRGICAFGTLYLGGFGGMPLQESLKMLTLGVAFSLILEQTQGHSGQT